MQDHEVITDYETFLETCVLSNPFRNSMNGKTVTLRTRSGLIPVIKVEDMYCPFGLSKYNEKFSLDMSIKEPRLLEFLQKLDASLLEKPTKDDSWLGGIKTTEMTSASYVSRVKESKPPGKYPPSLKGSVLLTDSGKNSATKLFDSNRQEIPVNVSNLPKGCRCSGLVSIGSVWIIGNRYGLTVRFKQLKKVGSDSIGNQGSNVVLDSYAFVDDSDDDIE